MTKDELKEKLRRQAKALLESILDGETIDPGLLEIFTKTVNAMNSLDSMERKNP